MALQTQHLITSKDMAWVPDNRYSALLTLMFWTLVVMMVVPEGFDYSGLDEPSPGPSSGSPVSRIIWLSLLGLGVLVTIWRAAMAWLLVRDLNLYFLLIIGLAIASIAWSIEPSLTVRRIIRLVTFVFVCLALVLSGWHTQRFQNVLRPILTIMLVGSILFAMFMPHLAIEQSDAAELAGAWRGLATQKNGLGALACLAMIFWVHAWLAREVKPLPALFGISVAATCLVFSRSSTSLAATIVVIFLMIVLMRLPYFLRPVKKYLVSILVAIILIYSLAMLNLVPGSETLLQPIVALTGKDMTFTGRSTIWAIMADHISWRPKLGSGFAAYWTPVHPPGKESYVFIEQMYGFYPGSAHNGYLEILNDLGWVGMLLFLAYIITYIRQSLQLHAIDLNQSMLYLALFFQQAITNLSESHWFNVLSVDFVIMAFATIALGRSLLEIRLRTVFGVPPNSDNGMNSETYDLAQVQSSRYNQSRMTT